MFKRDDLQQVADSIQGRIAEDWGKVMVLGVGGNSSTAAHLVGELSGQFEGNTDPIPAICLTDNVPSVTAIATDFGWDEVFERQVRALGRYPDVLLAFTIGGSGEYLRRAIAAADELGIPIMLVGGTPENAAKLLNPNNGDVHVDFGSTDTPKVQEAQLHFVHELCRILKPPKNTGG